MSMTIQELIRRSYDTAREKGWHDDSPGQPTPAYVVEKLCLVHSEISEAVEEVRSGHTLGEVYEGPKGKPEGFMVEIADAFIRCADLIGKAGLAEEFEAALVAKMAFNGTRPYRHNKVL